MFLLASNYSSGWEAVFVGALQGGFIFLCLLVYRFFKNKRNAKKEYEEAEKDKVSSFIETTSTEHDNNSASVNGSVSNSDSYLKSVFKEMVEKCNPQNYMNPYDHEKVRVANEVYSSLMSYETLNEEVLMSLRHRAIVELGVVFDTNAIYKYLATKCSPSNFFNPYDAEKVSLANDIYSQLEKNKGDIEILEQIRDEAISLGLLRSSSTDYSIYSEEKYTLGQWKTSKGTILRIETTRTEPSDTKLYYLYEDNTLVYEMIRSESKAVNISSLFHIPSNPAVTYQIYAFSGKLEKCVDGHSVEKYKVIVVYV